MYSVRGGSTSSTEISSYDYVVRDTNEIMKTAGYYIDVKYFYFEHTLKNYKYVTMTLSTMLFTCVASILMPSGLLTT